MSDSYSSEHKRRIAQTLEDHREAIERVAETDTKFAKRANSALEWLEEHTEEADSDEE